MCLLLWFFLTLFHFLEEAEDELEDVITGQTESMQFDHPNHTVTVTTITELDLTGAHLLGPVANQVSSKPSTHLDGSHVCLIGTKEADAD